MYFIFSGEGASDFGNTGLENNFQPGPLAIIADQIITKHHGYSFLNYNLAVYFSSADLEKIKKNKFTPKSRRSIRLPSPDVPPENRFHYDDARALSRAAADFIGQKEKSDREFVAVLFRDSNSPDKKVWTEKRNSMLTGFRIEKIETQGVAAVARPSSEAWWHNALKRKANPNPVGKKYEEMRRGGNEGAHRLKKELGEDGQREALVEMVQNGEIDYNLIDAESFLAFKHDFENAVGLKHLPYQPKES